MDDTANAGDDGVDRDLGDEDINPPDVTRRLLIPPLVPGNGFVDKTLDLLFVCPVVGIEGSRSRFKDDCVSKSGRQLNHIFK